MTGQTICVIAKEGSYDNYRKFGENRTLPAFVPESFFRGGSAVITHTARLKTEERKWYAKKITL